MKIANIRDFCVATNYPTYKQLNAAVKKAKKLGYGVGDDGRCYIPFKVSTPLLEDGTHGRWEKGRVVPRKRA